MTVTKVIGKCPRDGREWDCQCARCGSSCFFEDCDNCGGEGEIEDDDWQWAGEFYRCDWCRGEGTYAICCSSADWCEAHPGEGREEVKRGSIEWFTFDAPRSSQVRGATSGEVCAVDPVGETGTEGNTRDDT